MKTAAAITILFITQWVSAQVAVNPNGITLSSTADTTRHVIYNIGNISPGDTMPTINLQPVNIVSFKSLDEWNKYYIYKSRIVKVMPYVKIARELYAELQEKEEDSKKRDYRHYRKDLEKQMRGKFEKELKDLTVGQGEMLFKLINRETGNNCYKIIKDIKGPFSAWFYQIVAKHWGYNLKQNYDPDQEKMIELIIKEMGPGYKV